MTANSFWTPTIAILPLGDSDAPRMDAIDLSSNNNGGKTITVDQFRYMKQCGVKTIIVKLTEGTSYIWWGANQDIKNAEAAGLNIAVYHYAHYTNATEAVNEANYFANIIQKFGLSNDTVVVDDLESSETAVASAAANTRAFFNQLSNRGYDNHVLYTFVSYQQRDNVISVVGNDRVWMAQYPYTPSRNNLWNTQYGAWQFSSTVTIPGLSGYFDASIDYKNIFNQASDKPHEVYQNGHWYLQQDGKNLTGFQTIYDNTLHHDKTVYYNAQGQCNTANNILMVTGTCLLMALVQWKQVSKLFMMVICIIIRPFTTMPKVKCNTANNILMVTGTCLLMALVQWKQVSKLFMMVICIIIDRLLQCPRSNAIRSTIYQRSLVFIC